MLVRGTAILLAASAVASASDQLTLVGTIDPPGSRTTPVWLRQIGTPFWTAKSAAAGKFTFKHLEAGTYVVTVGHASGAEIRRTVHVTPQAADFTGRVPVSIAGTPSTAAQREGMRRRHTVGAKALTVSQSAWYNWRRAQALESEGKRERARQRLEKAIRSAPQFTEALVSRGLLDYQAGNFAGAESWFRRATASSDTSYEAAANLAAALLQLGHYADSAHWSHRAIALAPDGAYAHANLGLALYFTGDLPAAARALERVVNIDPGHFSVPQLALAKIYAEQGQGTRAIELLVEVAEVHSGTESGQAAERILDRIAPLRGAYASTALR